MPRGMDVTYLTRYRLGTVPYRHDDYLIVVCSDKWGQRWNESRPQLVKRADQAIFTLSSKNPYLYLTFLQTRSTCYQQSCLSNRP